MPHLLQGYGNGGADMEMADSTPGDTNGSRNGVGGLDGVVSPSQHNGDDDGVERTSNWLVAAAYNITAIIGVGVLGIPHAMVFLTWGWGVVVLILAFFITFFTMKQLIKLHEFELLNKGKRYDTYHKLGQRAFGKKRGLLIIWPLQMIVEVSLDILFTVAAGEAMNRIHNLGECNRVHIFVWFAVFATIQIVLSISVPNFESKYLKIIVGAAAIMSVCYSATAWIAVVSIAGEPKGPHVLPDQLLVDHSATISDLKLNKMDQVFRAFNAIGVIAFAYAAHNVVLEIQNGIPSSNERTSEKEMLRGMWLTYVVVALCYFPMGIAVYKMHGNQISQNVLSFIQYQLNKALDGTPNPPTALIIVTNMMLIIHLIGSYQIFAMPVFKQLEILSRPLFKGRHPLIKKNSSCIIRPLYIAFTTLIAMICPHFSPLLGFFGGFVIAPTTYFLPCIIWLKIKNPKRWKSRDWYINWVCIILGVLLMIVATMGGVYVLKKDWSDFKTLKLWTKDWKDSKLVSCKAIVIFK